jgi:hypothetical protein
VLIRLLLLAVILIAIGHFVPQKRGVELIAMSQSCRSPEYCEQDGNTAPAPFSSPRPSVWGRVSWPEALVFLIGAIAGGAIGWKIGYNFGRSSVKAPPNPVTVKSDVDVDAAAAPWITQARRVPAAELMLQKQLDDILEALKKLGLVP